MQKLNNKSKFIVVIALNAAIFVLLSYYGTIQLNNNYKFTLQNLPIYLTAMIFGRLAGMYVGFIGMTIHQIIGFGFDVLNIIWVIPYVIIAFIFGTIYNDNDNKYVFSIKIIIINLILTILNTIALYIHSKLYGYYSYQLVFSSLLIRFISSIITSIIYIIVLPYLYKLLNKFIK